MLNSYLHPLLGLGNFDVWMWVFFFNLPSNETLRSTKKAKSIDISAAGPLLMNWSLPDSLFTPSVSIKAPLRNPLVKSYLDMLANLIASTIVEEERLSHD